MSLKMIVLTNPKMCDTCRFNRMALVQRSDGTTKAMRHCLRRDCDNWEEADTPIKPVAVYVDGQRIA